MLMRKCDKESKVNKRLLMDFEELIYKVNLVDSGFMENLSKLGGFFCYSENSFFVMRRKFKLFVFGDLEKFLVSYVYRRSLFSVENFVEKKMKRRFANFLLEKERIFFIGSSRYRVKTYLDSCSSIRGLYIYFEIDRMAYFCEEVLVDKFSEDGVRFI